MKKREAYQIIIMRPTGERPVMTLRAFWVRLLIGFIAALCFCLVAAGVWLVDTRLTVREQGRIIAMQSGELRDANILLTQKDEEIISLKTKISMTITHNAPPVLETKPVPELHPPIVEISEVALSGGRLTCRIANLKAQDSGVAQGYFFAVFKAGQEYACYPSATLSEGMPDVKKMGQQFSIKNYKPMSIEIPSSTRDWKSVTFYVFDDEEKMRLAMPVRREQIQ